MSASLCWRRASAAGRCLLLQQSGMAARRATTTVPRRTVLLQTTAVRPERRPLHTTPCRAQISKPTERQPVATTSSNAPSSASTAGAAAATVVPEASQGESGSGSQQQQKQPRRCFGFTTSQLALGAVLGAVGTTGGLFLLYEYNKIMPPPAEALAEGTASDAASSDTTTTDPLALHKLPPLIKEHRDLPFFERLWFYLRLGCRALVLGAVWVPVISLGLVLTQRAWLRLVVRTLELCGPVFIKLGQWVATRPDLFPRAVCTAFARLQAEVKAHSFYTTLRTCEDNFGGDLTVKGMRLEVESTMIGSGSMGQVHRGWVSAVDGTGPRTEVAVKVLHPHLHSRVMLDLTLLYYAAATITKIPYSELQWVSIPEMLIQFTEFMGSHLDLHQEAQNMQDFRRNFRDSPNISFPEPIHPFVGAHVLVQSVARGIPLGHFLHGTGDDETDDDLDSTQRSVGERITKAYLLEHEAACREARSANRPEPPPPVRRASPLHSEIARLGLQMYLHMLVQDNFVHSDLHPGNILVQILDTSGDFTPAPASASVSSRSASPSSSSVANLHSPHVQLVILDSGLVSTLTPRNRFNFLSLFGALIMRDGRLAARLMLENAPRQACVDVAALEEDMHSIVSVIPLESLSRVDLGRLLSEVMNTVRRHHVKLESDFASLVISLAIIEGIGRQLDPDLSLIHEAVPVMIANRETRSILLQTAGVQACAKMGLILAKDEFCHLSQAVENVATPKIHAHRLLPRPTPSEQPPPPASRS